MAGKRRRRKPTRASEHRKLLRDNRQHYDGILNIQMGVCGICGKPPPENRRHALDHDHKTMTLRGVLCTSCNMRLSDRHTVEWLESALYYLTHSPAEMYFRLKEKLER